jgi:Na+/phosphate symporter
MPLLAFGVILIFQSSKSLEGIGYILAGRGFLFLGMHYMKEGFGTFKAALPGASIVASVVNKCPSINSRFLMGGGVENVAFENKSVYVSVFKR